MINNLTWYALYLVLMFSTQSNPFTCKRPLMISCSYSSTYIIVDSKMMWAQKHILLTKIW